LKYAIINDTHFGARKTSEIIIEEQRHFFQNVFFPYCKKNKISKIFHAGDYFTDRYALTVKSLNASRKIFLDRLVEENMTMEIIPGNHDLGYKNSSSLNSLKESFGYFLPHVIIHTQVTEQTYEDDFSVLWIPWVNSENQNKTIQAIEKSSANVVIGHLALSGFELFKGQIAKSIEDETITAEMLKKFRLVLSGHYHHKSIKDNIVYLGTQYQMTWNDHDSKKFFHILDTKNPNKLYSVENKKTLFENVYYDDKKEIEKILTYKPEILKGKYVKVYIKNKNDPHLFNLFVEKLNEFSGAHQIRIMPFQEQQEQKITKDNDGEIILEERKTLDLIYDFIEDTANKDLYDIEYLKKLSQNMLIETETMSAKTFDL